VWVLLVSQVSVMTNHMNILILHLEILLPIKLLSWTFTLFPYSPFSLCDYSCLITWSIAPLSLLFFLSFHCSTLSCPITSDLNLAIISESSLLLSYALIFSPHPHSLLSIKIISITFTSDLLFYVNSSYWTFYSTGISRIGSSLLILLSSEYSYVLWQIVST